MDQKARLKARFEVHHPLAKLVQVQTPDKHEYFSTLPLPESPPETLLVTPNNPPWNSTEAFGVWIVSVLAIIFIPGILLLPYLLIRDPQILQSEKLGEFALTDPTALVLQILAIFPALLLTLVLCWFVVTRGKTFDFRTTLGWQKGGLRWWHYVAILATFFLIAGVVQYFFPEQENYMIRILKSSRSVVYVVAFVAVVAAPLGEEVVYRGILYSAFQRSFGVPAGFALTSFLFALVHLPQYYPSYSTMFLLALLSVTLTAIRVKSGNLLPCIVLHTLFNGMQSILLIVEPWIQIVEIPDQTASFLNLLENPWF